jgi:pilus assembly protein Flp/PilA
VFIGGEGMLKKVFELLKCSKGATAIEYALIASLIAVVAIAAMKSIGNKISAQLNNIAGNIG